MAAPDGSFAYCRRNINHERIVSIHDLQKLSKIELDLAMLWSEWNRRRFEGRTSTRFSSAQWPISELQCQRCRSRSMADRRKDRGRATSGRIEITSSGGSSYVWRLRVTRMHFMVILIFVIVEVKRGSCFSFLIQEGRRREYFKNRELANETFLAFSEIYFFWNVRGTMYTICWKFIINSRAAQLVPTSCGNVRSSMRWWSTSSEIHLHPTWRNSVPKSTRQFLLIKAAGPV